MDIEGDQKDDNEISDNENDNPEKNKCLRSAWARIRRRSRKSSATDWLISLCTITIAITGFFQYLTLEKTDNTSRLRDRAFINFYDPKIERNTGYNPPRLTIRIIAQNTGNVPARNVSISYDCVITEKFKEIIDPFPIAKFSIAQIPRYIGPNQIVSFLARDDTNVLLDRVINGEIDVFVVIKAEYIDGFDNVRMTQMSRQLHVDKTRQHSLSFAGSHNCIDEDCKQ